MAAPYELPTGAALLRCTASGIEDLLEQASDHVTAAMQQFDHEEQRGSDESAATAPPPGMSGWRSKRVRTALVAILRRAFKGKSAQKEETSPKRVKRGQVDADEFEYHRLKNGFTGLFEHVQALDKSREGLKRAVAQLRIHSEDLHRIAQDAAERERERGLDRASLSTLFAAYEPALRDVVVRVPQLAHLLVMAKETHSVRRMQATLDERVAPITQSKLHQLQHFQGKLEEREALKHATYNAQRQLAQLQDGFSDGKKGVTSAHVCAASRAFRRLRRRLEAMDAALAHVFRFHYQLDQCVADPELCIVHDALSQLFSGA